MGGGGIKNNGCGEKKKTDHIRSRLCAAVPWEEGGIEPRHYGCSQNGGRRLKRPMGKALCSNEGEEEKKLHKSRVDFEELSRDSFFFWGGGGGHRIVMVACKADSTL